MTDCTRLTTDYHLCPEGWRLYFEIDDDRPETLEEYRQHRTVARNVPKVF
jgi:predicted transcriptional regulator